MPALAQHLAIGIMQLGRERSLTDAGHVGLGNAQHIPDIARADPGPRRSLTRDGVGRGDEGIGPVIDVQQGALGAFKQDFLVRLDGVFQDAPDRGRIGQDFRRDLGQLGDQLVGTVFGMPQAAAQRIVVVEDVLHPGLEGGGVGQVNDADSAAADLVLIGRADAAACGADRLAIIAILAQGIEFAVDGQDQGRRLGDFHDVGRDHHTLLRDALNLGDEGPGIDNHAIANDRQLAAHDTGGEKRELVHIFADNEGMTGIVTALEAGHHIGAV